MKNISTFCVGINELWASLKNDIAV
jgi:hypothetical protein